VTEFRKTREFERMIAEYTGSQYCSVVSNGTVSLSIALLACEIGIGDEVIVPDYTMVATANALPEPVLSARKFVSLRMKKSQ
ncbi:MAG: DegT/DnrJ/EryC1/StrS family aminotransferase, partial [Clostridia bacterium]|nr:DegT/DnrJ/EryC1/StrS family aminotransferase [Clostridia bacterium]